MENVRNHRDIKLVTNKKRIKLVSEPNYYTAKKFLEELIPIEMKKIKIDKCGYFSLTILELSNLIMCEFCYDYVKPKYGENAIFFIWIQIVS